ncbi:MAG: hypothetical protein CVT92_05675 [Bacteroidetes bacterium HGW-Bacteroidetes-1]|jgi:glycine cleavage system H lipoate-binding protein|nr:MAG: hypothetical protein CVT92_05675 [Bacteroidetes bacterium HGW-Bacteroidetes-1]
MKTKTSFIISVLLIFALHLTAQNATKPVIDKNTKSLSLFVDKGLEQLVTDWEKAFRTVNPDASFILQNKIEDNDGISIIYGNSLTNNLWRIPIGRDVIVPVINMNNPLLSSINTQGMTMGQIADVLSGTNNQSWSFVLNSEGGHALNVYIGPDEQIVSGITNAFDIPSISYQLKTLQSKQALIDAVENDVYALGFCRLSDVIDEGNSFVSGLAILPIDRNNNGHIDAGENFYSDPETLNRAIWIGKYPKSLSRTIYATVNKTSPDEHQTAFLFWMMNDGQKAIASNGFTAVTNLENQANLSKISSTELLTKSDEPEYAWVKILFIALATFLIVGFVLARLFNEPNEINSDTVAKRKARLAFHENNLQAPKGLLYDKSHTWAFMEKDGMVKIGMDAFMQHILGPVSRIQMLKDGEQIAKGEAFATIIQEGKQVVLRSPITGSIVAKNDAIISGDNNEIIDNWIYKIEPRNWKREIQFMLMVDQYIDWMKDEFVRFKDFLARTLHKHSPQYVNVVFQDGGELKEGLMSELGPEIWEDFQNQFLNTTK